MHGLRQPGVRRRHVRSVHDERAVLCAAAVRERGLCGGAGAVGRVAGGRNFRAKREVRSGLRRSAELLDGEEFFLPGEEALLGGEERRLYGKEPFLPGEERHL